MDIDTLLRKAMKTLPHSMRGRVKRLPLVGKAQRYLVNTRLSGKAFVHTVDAGPSRGITYELMLPEDKGIWIGNYEPEFASRLLAEMRPGMVGYDIGAWHGYFTGVMLANGATKVVMFEPLPENRSRLKRLIELNPSYNIMIQPVALGDRIRKARLTQMEETSMAKLTDSPFQPERNTGNEITVTVETMDAMVARGAVPPPDIIKIDVEGAEGMVLKGAEQTLSTARPIVLAEIHSGSLMREVSELLVSHRYTVDAIDASGLRREPDARHICARPAS